METKIRGEGGDESTRMIVGQMRRVFDPDYIQIFDGLVSSFTVQFRDKSKATDAVIRFAEMYGYDLKSTEDSGVYHKYYFR